MTRKLPMLLLLLLPVSTAYADAKLGRLFFTPDQRAALDQARLRNKNLDAASEPAPDNFTLNGVIKRSDGQHIVWINQRAFSDRSSEERVSVSREKNSGRYTVQLPYSDKRIQLKVGQSMDAASGKIEEAYRNKTATNPAKPAAPAANPDKPASSGRTLRHKNELDDAAQ